MTKDSWIQIYFGICFLYYKIRREGKEASSSCQFRAAQLVTHFPWNGASSRVLRDHLDLMYDPCACLRCKGLGNSGGDSFLLNWGLKWTLQFLAKRAHRNLWARCLWGCWFLAKNRKKAECWLINIHNYRNFLQTNAHVSSFSHHNGHCVFSSQKKLRKLCELPSKGKSCDCTWRFLILK